MEVRRIGHILAFKADGKDPLGFHAANMEVARLSPEIWQDLKEQIPDPSAAVSSSEAMQALVDWNSSTNTAIKTDLWNHDRGLKAITINVTQMCNLACKYCAAGGDGSYGDPVKRISVENTLPQLKSLMKRATAGGSFQITFLGGEPLLYPDGIRILAEVAKDYARELDLKLQFVVVTNGSQFSPANIEVLKEIKANITVSIDGGAAVNDLRRPNKGGRGVTQSVIEGLTRLLAEKSQLGRIGLSGVFGKGNLDLMAGYEFYRGFAVDWFDFTFDHFELDPTISAAYIDGLLAVANRAYLERGEAGLRQIKLFDNYFQHLDSQQRIENHCGAGKNFLMVDARNQVTTCPWLVGEAKEAVGFGERLWEEKLKPFAESLIEQNGCGDCWARFLCGGGCMYVHRNKTGDKHAVDTEFCKRTKTILLQTFGYYLECRDAGSSQAE